MSIHVEELMRKNVIDHLNWDDSVNANNVDVVVRGDTVQLNGTVESYSAKMSAHKDALKVAGIKHVENNLKIRLPENVELPGDQELSSKVRNILEWDSRINENYISVNSEHGNVTLSGKVNTYWEKFLAEEATNSLNGVQNVTNEMKVSPTVSRIDIEIERDIKNAFMRSALVDEKNIGVTVKDGIVHLNGNVANHLIKREAYETALYTAGVKDVIDMVTIG
jgi:osmotically-inducible protein OsmY